MTALTVISAGLELSPKEFKYMPIVGTGCYESRGLAQVEAAKQLGVNKSRMSNLMNHRIDLFMLAEPDIEGNIDMARRQPRIMIVRLAICGNAAIWLQCNDQIFRARH